MATPNTILKKGACVKNAVLENKVKEHKVSFRRKYIDDKGEIQKGTFEANAVTLCVRPYRKLENLCPVCMRKCQVYDRVGKTKTWRTVDNGNMLCYVEGPAHRVLCPEHGRITVYVPWAAQNTGFTHEFDMLVTWLCMRLSKADVAELLLIDWDTVGKCVSRVLKRLEPDPNSRLDGLVNIGVDETSYRKGHLYITIVVNHDTNEVVWASEGVGKETFMKFFEALTPEQRASIKTLSGDGAKWIDECLEEYGMKDQVGRCVDSFHVVSWITDALDELRRDQWNSAREDLKQLKKDMGALTPSAEMVSLDDAITSLKAQIEAAKHAWKSFITELKLAEESISDLKKGLKSAKSAGEKEEIRTSLEAHKSKRDNLREYRNSARERYLDLKRQMEECVGNKRKMLEKFEKENGCPLSQAESRIKNLKGCKYALLKNPDHLTKNQEEAVELIQASYPDLYEGYRLKEELRVMLHTNDPALAADLIDAWADDAKKTGAQLFMDLAEKILRNKKGILNTIRLGLSNARIESMNNKIKLIIRRAYGFSNTSHMIDMVMLVCSNLPVNLPNRPPSNRKKIAAMEAAIRKQRKASEQTAA